MLQRFDNGIVETRCEILFTSMFMKNNKIKTYSELCNKDRIVIDHDLGDYEIDDLKYFLGGDIKIKKTRNKKIYERRFCYYIKFT